MNARSTDSSDVWPALPFEEGRDTLATLHMWVQIVGKIRVALTPWVNHQWHATLHMTSRGLTSRPIPFRGDTFQIDFDFLDHQLILSRSNGRRGRVELKPRSVADFFHSVMGELRGMGIEVEIHGAPNEVADPIPFRDNERDGSYEVTYVEPFFQALSSTARVFQDFRGGFLGKSSPVHFFWGAMDLAVTRFSGRRAPEHPGGIPNLPDWITREAYSHEVSSAGFWPGGESNPAALFYAYAYPSPEGYPEASVRPAAAGWNSHLSEFVLSYDDIRTAPSPEAELMDFLQSTYEVAAELGGWDRDSLEWAPGERPPTGGYGGDAGGDLADRTVG